MSSNVAVSQSQFTFGPFRLDAKKRVLWRGNEVVALPPKAVTLLSTLAGAGGDVVAKDKLMAQVWPPEPRVVMSAGDGEPRCTGDR